MYKVLIVDDEVLVRVGLKTTIDWESIGFTIVGEASNGEQGYEQYKKCQPDVVITDIKMPKKDGIWLVNEIRKENKDVKILVLTCYDDFSYVRKALKSGSDDYILKSEIEDEELLNIMENTKKKLKENQKNIDNKERIKLSKNNIRRTILTDMIKSNFKFNSKILERCEEVGFKIRNTEFIFVTISISDLNFEFSSKEKNFSQISSALLNIIFSQFFSREIEYVYNGSNKKFTFLLSLPNEKDFDLKKMFFAIEKSSKQYFDLNLNIIYSEKFQEIFNFENYYDEFIHKAEIMFYKNQKESFLASTDEIMFSTLNFFDLKEEYNKIFIKNIGLQNYDEILNKSIEIKNRFIELLINPGIAKVFYSNLIGDIINQYQEFLKENKKVINYTNYHYKIVNSEYFDQVLEITDSFIIEVLKVMEKLKFHNSELITKNALNFINMNYDKKISLEDVAFELNLSKQYLCSVFSKEFGENMLTYINKLRIEKTKELLINKDCRVKDIYDKVGFSNQQYFSRVFKKITGQTIIEYKNTINKQ